MSPGVWVGVKWGMGENGISASLTCERWVCVVENLFWVTCLEKKAVFYVTTAILAYKPVSELVPWVITVLQCGTVPTIAADPIGTDYQ